MEDVLAHPLGPLLWALANVDGCFGKTHKAARARELENILSHAEVIPTPSTRITDGMGLVQRMTGNYKTFAQLTESVLSMVLYVGVQSGRVDVVFYAYRQPSIKYSERLDRGASTTLQYKCLAGGHSMQQWRQFLCSSFNKTSLVKSLVGEWKLQRYRYMLHGNPLYVTLEETCFKMAANEWVEVVGLQCTQEEAVIVTSEDIDVMLLCLASKRISHIPSIRSMGHSTAHDFRDQQTGLVVGRQHP